MRHEWEGSTGVIPRSQRKPAKSCACAVTETKHILFRVNEGTGGPIGGKGVKG